MSTAQVPAPQPNVFMPVLLRGIISLAFGLAVVFVPDVGPVWRSALTGLFFLVSALATVWLSWLEDAVPAAARRLLGAQSVLLVLGAVAAFLMHTGTGYQIISALAFLLSGAVEVVLGLRFRHRSVLGRDWLTVGGVWILGAVVLGVVGQASSRAPAGVVGGVAVITGVVLVLAALSYRHDARSESGTQTGFDAESTQ